MLKKRLVNFLENLESYIESYDIEKLLYKKGKDIKLRGWLTKEEFLQICLWKSRRPKKWYILNDTQSIKKLTKKSLACEDEVMKISFLTELKGVSIPTASAILSVIDPSKYPIIDIRCMKTMVALGLMKDEGISIKSWCVYLKEVRKLAKQNKKAPREIEKGLFAYNQTMLDKDYKNLI